MTLTVGSLFSGIGGMDLGLERAGCTVKWQVENDEYCTRVLAKHWPDVPRFGDIRDVGAADLAPVDLIAGGFPCQDVSNAGKRAGIDGEQSGLWSEFARLVGGLRPRYVLVENVAALLGRGIERVLGDLASLGYDADWTVLSAAQFGAPHIRQRFFLIAYQCNGTSPTRPAQWNLLADTGCFGMERMEHQPWSVSPADMEKGYEDVAASPSLRQRMAQHGMDYGSASGMDRARGLGNAVVPQVAEYIGRLIIADALSESESAA